MSNVRKEKIEIASFGKVLGSIDSQGKELSQLTDTLRNAVKSLCGRYSITVKNQEEAERVANKLRQDGWGSVSIKRGEIEAEGFLVSRLKRTGVEFTSKGSYASDWDGPDSTETETYHLAFGKIGGEWQFFSETHYNYHDDETRPTTIDQLPRWQLDRLVDALPEFLNEYEKNLMKQREEISARTNSVLDFASALRKADVD
jgi:hypothetical protein